MIDMRLMHGDCLELMKQIPDKSIDLVLTDPPYNIGKAKWDKIPNYIEWCGKWFIECQRVLKDNGSFYWWHNDMVQIAQLMEWLRANSNFVFNSFIIWDKGDFMALSWKNPSDVSNLRSWFNTCEYCLFYTFQDETGLSTVMLDTNNFPTMRRYFKDLQEFIGLGLKTINTRLGHRRAEHCFYWKTTQWDMPTPETYRQLIEAFNIDKWEGYKEYESLRQEYESLRYTHNLDTNHNNVWRSQERNNGKQHPTQKPNDLMERIIKTSSNQGDTVLDLFMGSGSTGVACVNNNRNFIGIEKDGKYFEIAKQRLDDFMAQPRLEEALFEPPEQVAIM
jgi:site-specific DNA-methyltransferase (adenine-specific)